MTLTPEQEARKKLWIQKNGLDPEQFDYDVENDVFVPRTPTAEQQPQEVVPPDGSSPLKTAVKAAAYNLPEATGGLAAAGAGALAGAPLGPVGSVAGGLIVGFGGSALAGKAKEAALEIPFVRRAAEYLGMSPEEMAKEQQTNPKAYLAGELGSNLPFFSVSGGIRGVGRAAGALRSLPLPTRMPAQDIAALGNVAIGAGLGAGQSIGSDLISGRDINWGNAATQTAAGALLNSPRRLGTMVSLGTMHPMPGDEIGARFNEASRLAQDATPVKPPTAAAPATEPAIPETGGIRFPTATEELTLKILQNLKSFDYNPAASQGLDKTFSSTPKPKAKPAGPYQHTMTPWQIARLEAIQKGTGVPFSSLESPYTGSDLPMSPWKAAKIESAEAEQLATATQQKQRQLENLKKKNDFESGRQEELEIQQRELELQRKRQEAEQLRANEQQTDAEQQAADQLAQEQQLAALPKASANAKRYLKIETGVARPEIRPENPVDQLMGEAEPRSEAEILQDEMEGTGARYSPARKQKAPVTAEPVTFKSEATPPAEPESQLPAGLVAAIQHLGGKKYRTNVEVTGDPIVMQHAQEGVPAGTLARGVMQPRENPAASARIRLSRQLGLPETPAHELIEGVISDLQTHGNKSEKNFLKRFADSFGGLDAAIDAAASDFTGQLRDPSKGGIIQDWTDFIKYKMGRASRQEMARLMSNVLRRGAGAEEVLPRTGAGVAGAARYSPVTKDEEVAKTFSDLRTKQRRLPESLGTSPEETQNPTYAEYFKRMKEAAANAPAPEPAGERELPSRTPKQRIEDRRANSSEHVNWRYSPASDRFGQINNPDEIKGEGFSFFTPLTEKLARSGNAMKEHFAKKFLDLTNKQREMWGGWMNGMLEARGNLSPQEWNNVYHTLVDEGRKHADLSAGLNPNELEAYKKLRTIYEEMGKNRLAAGQLVSGRAGGVDPHGMFEVIDRDVLRVMLEHANTPQAQQLRQEFIDHQVNNGVTPAKAEQKLKTLLGHFGEITDLQNNFKFNAVRTPEGVGLPDSWIEKDFDAAIRRYTRRFATDRAFFDVIEKDPRMMSALGADKMANGAAIPPAHAVGPDNLVGGDPAVRTLLASYIGTDLGHREPFHASLGRFVNSLILGGPITKLTDLGSVPFHALRYVRTQDIPGLLASMANWKNGYANAFKTGLNKRGGLIVATEILGAHEQAARALDRAAEFVTKATGSEQLELLSRGLAQAMGEFVGRTQRGLALGGDKRAIGFLEKLGSDWQSASAEELGTRVAKLMQGRYDLTNMPAWMRTSPIAPFFSMMRWSVEQWNNFRNFAVQPAMQGNVMPLAHSLIGAVAGGALINEMRQTIAGKKPYTATEEELNAASAAGAPGVDKERIYKWIAAANITGTMGIVGEMTRQLYEVTTQKTPQGFQYPVAGVLQDIALRGASAMAAIHDGEDPAEIAGQYVKDIAKDNVQIIRLAMNAYARANPESEEGKQLEYKNRRRDVTMFNSLYGYPVSKSPKAFPEYSGQSERELDAEQNPQKAARLATNLTQRALKRANGNPAILESELRKLRTAPNLIMPSPDQDPIRFAQYYKYIQATQGPDKARALLHDYYRNNALREMKRDMIPSVSSR